MGNSATVFGDGIKKSNEGKIYFISPDLETLCSDCLTDKTMSQSLSTYIKDGTWMDLLAAKVPFYVRPEKQEIDYFFPSSDSFQHVLKKLQLPKKKIGNVFTYIEQRLILLSAIGENFKRNDEELIINNLSDIISTGNTDIHRAEVYKVTQLLLIPAMYYDEDVNTAFINETAWIQDLPPLMYNIPLPLLILDTQTTIHKNITSGRIVYTNKSWEKMTKFSFEEIKGKKFKEVMFCSQSEEEQINLLSNAVESAQALKIGITCQRKNGDLFLNLMGVVPIVTDSQGTFRFVGILHCDASNEKEFDKHLSITDEIMPLLPFIIKTPCKNDEISLTIPENSTL